MRGTDDLDGNHPLDVAPGERARPSCSGAPCWLAVLNGEDNSCPKHGDAEDVVVYPEPTRAA